MGTLKLTNIFLYPDETFEQRQERAHKILKKYFDDVMKDPERCRGVFLQYRKTPEGVKYLINEGTGIKYKLPYWLEEGSLVEEPEGAKLELFEE